VRTAIVAKDARAATSGRELLLEAGGMMGFLGSNPQAWFQGGADDDLKAKVEALIADRHTARTEKNWPEADRIRDALTALNVEVMDGPTGATWRIREQA
jgi:cysteinyl-tRNA synthetase